MDSEIRERFEKAGVDVTEALERFMNKDDLFDRFMKKFKDDTNLKWLEDSVAQGNVDDAFKAAHTLKGVASNLSLKGLLEPLVPLVEKLRAGEIDGAEQMLAKVKEAYSDIISAIDSL